MAPYASPAETLADPRPLRLIVLAGQRRDTPDALAERFGVSHRCLVPLGDRPLIAHVLQTGAQHPRVASLAVCIEREAFDPVWDMLTRLPGRGSVALIEAHEDLAQSVRAAAADWDGPLLVTTADHALLSAEAIDATLAALEGADVTFALARREAVEAVHPSGQRRYMTLREGEFASCDIYGVAEPRFLAIAEVFRGRKAGGRFDWRILRATGLVGLLALRLGLESLASAIDRASRRFAMRVRAVLLPDGTQAIDVGDEATYAIARDLLERRGRTGDHTGEKGASDQDAARHAHG